MKEYKSKLTTKLFWTICAFCGGWFVLNLTAELTHNFLIAVVAAIIVVCLILYKVFVSDNFSVILTDDNKFLVKRFGKIITSLDIDKYSWSEYSQYSNTKNAEDQDIYYISKETGNECYFDCSNFSGDDYEQLLTALGARNQNSEPIKVDTVKK